MGNYLDSDIDILHREGEKLLPVGWLKLDGHPASLRGASLRGDTP